MNIWVILADTGRGAPGTGGLNLLNAGWTSTTAMPLPDGSFTIPGQAVAIFVEVPWDQINREFDVVVELLDDEGHVADLAGPNGPEPARAEHSIGVPPVVGAPNGTPGRIAWLWDLPAGSLRVAPRCSYIWRVKIGDDAGQAGFWVEAPPAEPKIGQATPPRAPRPGPETST